MSDWSDPNNHKHFRKLANETVKVAKKVAINDPKERNAAVRAGHDVPVKTIVEDKKYIDLVLSLSIFITIMWF